MNEEAQKEYPADVQPVVLALMVLDVASATAPDFQSHQRIYSMFVSWHLNGSFKQLLPTGNPLGLASDQCTPFG